MSVTRRSEVAKASHHNEAVSFARHTSFEPRFGFVWSAAVGQPGAPWRTRDEVAAFASKVGAPPPRHLTASDFENVLRFEGAPSPVFAEMRFARSDLDLITLTRQALEAGSRRGTDVLTPSFLLRGLVPSEYALWRAGVLTQTSRFHVRPYAGRCPKQGDVPVAVLLEHWRWLTRRRGELAAYANASPRNNPQEGGEDTARGLPGETNALRQAALASALLRNGADIAPLGEFDLSRLPSPPRSIGVDRESPHRRFLIGEQKSLLVVEFDPSRPSLASSYVDSANGPTVIALTLGEAFQSDAHLSRVARTFEHLTTHLLLLRLAGRFISQLREATIAENVNESAARALSRSFIRGVEALWGWGECDDLHPLSFEAFDRVFRPNERWSLVLQRAGYLTALI